MFFNTPETSSIKSNYNHSKNCCLCSWTGEGTIQMNMSRISCINRLRIHNHILNNKRILDTQLSRAFKEFDNFT